MKSGCLVEPSGFIGLAAFFFYIYGGRKAAQEIGRGIPRGLSKLNFGG